MEIIEAAFAEVLTLENERIGLDNDFNENNTFAREIVSEIVEAAFTEVMALENKRVGMPIKSET